MINNRNLNVFETFYGYIENTKDALLIFEACKRGILPRVQRRLQDKERIMIRSGTIICFDEKESGIKRWTDGFVWSPSRIMGNFLVYRELVDKKNNNLFLKHQQERYLDYKEERQKDNQTIGRLKQSIKFKKNGLIKKSMSLTIDGIQQHIICYYTKEDIISLKLNTPSNIMELSSLKLSNGLTYKQNLRFDPLQLQFNTFEYKRNVIQKSESPSFSSNDSVISSLDSIVSPIIDNPNEIVSIDHMNICSTVPEFYTNFVNTSHHSFNHQGTQNNIVNQDKSFRNINYNYLSKDIERNNFQYIPLSTNINNNNSFMDDINFLLSCNELGL